jgi:hypothetical protein
LCQSAKSLIEECFLLTFKPIEVISHTLSDASIEAMPLFEEDVETLAPQMFAFERSTGVTWVPFYIGSWGVVCTDSASCAMATLKLLKLSTAPNSLAEVVQRSADVIKTLQKPSNQPRSEADLLHKLIYELAMDEGAVSHDLCNFRFVVAVEWDVKPGHSEHGKGIWFSLMAMEYLL